MPAKLGFVLKHLDPENRDDGPIYLHSKSRGLTDKIREALLAETEQEAETFRQYVLNPENWTVVPATIY